VLSSPSIVALDNQPALLQVGDEVPITTSSPRFLPMQLRDRQHDQHAKYRWILKVLPHVHANDLFNSKSIRKSPTS